MQVPSLEDIHFHRPRERYAVGQLCQTHVGLSITQHSIAANLPHTEIHSQSRLHLMVSTVPLADRVKLLLFTLYGSPAPNETHT